MFQCACTGTRVLNHQSWRELNIYSSLHRYNLRFLGVSEHAQEDPLILVKNIIAESMKIKSDDGIDVATRLNENIKPRYSYTLSTTLVENSTGKKLYKRKKSGSCARSIVFLTCKA